MAHTDGPQNEPGRAPVHRSRVACRGLSSRACRRRIQAQCGSDLRQTASAHTSARISAMTRKRAYSIHDLVIFSTPGRFLGRHGRHDVMAYCYIHAHTPPPHRPYCYLHVYPSTRHDRGNAPTNQIVGKMYVCPEFSQELTVFGRN